MVAPLMQHIEMVTPLVQHIEMVAPLVQHIEMIMRLVSQIMGLGTDKGCSTLRKLNFHFLSH